MLNKIKIRLNNNEQATEFITQLNKYPYNCVLYNEKENECVDAKSYLGVLYFMVIHPHDAYFYSGRNDIPDCVKDVMVHDEGN